MPIKEVADHILSQIVDIHRWCPLLYHCTNAQLPVFLSTSLVLSLSLSLPLSVNYYLTISTLTNKTRKRQKCRRPEEKNTTKFELFEFLCSKWIVRVAFLCVRGGGSGWWSIIAPFISRLILCFQQKIFPLLFASQFVRIEQDNNIYRESERRSRRFRSELHIYNVCTNIIQIFYTCMFIWR